MRLLSRNILADAASHEDADIGLYLRVSGKPAPLQDTLALIRTIERFGIDVPQTGDIDGWEAICHSSSPACSAFLEAVLRRCISIETAHAVRMLSAIKYGFSGLQQRFSSAEGGTRLAKILRHLVMLSIRDEWVGIQA